MNEVKPLSFDYAFEIRLTEMGFEWRYLGLNDSDNMIIDETGLSVFENALLRRIRMRNAPQFIENIDKWFSFRLKLDQMS